jgi:hypothetical protein
MGPACCPEHRDELFQPSFTTKPGGEDTGLGLSISYDIVTQQHGGTITARVGRARYLSVVPPLPGGTGSSNPLRSAGESVSPVPSMATGAKVRLLPGVSLDEIRERDVRPSRAQNPRSPSPTAARDRHPFPVPPRVYDQTIQVLKSAVQKAKSGRAEEFGALKRQERPSTECVQAQAWALLVERFGFQRGDCINARHDVLYPAWSQRWMVAGVIGRATQHAE